MTALPGLNQVIQEAQLSDELLSAHVPLQVSGPEVGDTIFITLRSRWAMEVIDCYVQALHGDGGVSITIEDAAPPVEFVVQGGSGGTVNGDGSIDIDTGATQRYDATGGLTNGDGTNEVQVNQNVKVTFTEVNSPDSLPAIFVLELQVRRLREQA